MTDAATATADTADTAPPSREIIGESVYERLPADRQAQLVKEGDGWAAPAVPTPDAAMKPVRPSWVPETAWHPETGFDQETFIRYFDEEVQPILQAEEARKASLPQSVDDYQVEVSPAFQLPPGDEIVLDPNDPMWGEAKALALRHGMSKEAFQRGVDLIVARDSITRAQFTRARNAELGKLGPAAQARVEAIEAAYVGLLGETDAKAAMARIWTAADVVRAEKVVAAFARAGRASSQPAGISDEAWAAMSQAERWEYSRSHDQKQFQR